MKLKQLFVAAIVLACTVWLGCARVPVGGSRQQLRVTLGRPMDEAGFRWKLTAGTRLRPAQWHGTASMRGDGFIVDAKSCKSTFGKQPDAATLRKLNQAAKEWLESKGVPVVEGNL
jgi:hypothetical protein